MSKRQSVGGTNTPNGRGKVARLLPELDPVTREQIAHWMDALAAQWSRVRQLTAEWVREHPEDTMSAAQLHYYRGHAGGLKQAAYLLRISGRKRGADSQG